MAAKDFKDDPFSKFNNKSGQDDLEIKKLFKNIQPAEEAINDNNKAKKPGRPKAKQGVYKNVNIAMPEDTLNKLEVIKQVYQNNLTLYINTLVEKDLKANYGNYLEVIESLKAFQKN